MGDNPITSYNRLKNIDESKETTASNETRFKADDWKKR
jgi:hypothetical protein